jgi:hypothetical protein
MGVASQGTVFSKSGSSWTSTAPSLLAGSTVYGIQIKITADAILSISQASIALLVLASE